jgi:biotin operon repressor
VTSLECAVLEELTGQPATLEDLATWTASPRRLVEDAVQALRLAGQPILADGRGVWLSADPEEIRRVVRSRRRRELSIARVTRALMQTANRLEHTEQPLWQEVA